MCSSDLQITLIFPADITFDRYNQFSWYGLYEERNKAATIPLANRKPFRKMIMDRYDYDTMDIDAVNKVHEAIDKQQIINKNHRKLNVKNEVDAFYEDY